MPILIDTLLYTAELSLVAVGLSAVFSISKFVNVAHVEFATLGALLSLLFAGWLGGSVLVACVLAAIVTGLFAVALERSVFRRLLRAGAAMAMIGSLALGIFLRAGFQTAFGTRPQSFERPLERAHSVLGGHITPTQITIIVTAAVVLGAFLYLLHRTQFGRTLRAVAANRQLGESSGINVQRSVDAVWFLSGAVAAVGGTLIAINTQVSMNIGFNMLLPIIAAAILGGIGSPLGAIVGAAILAFAESVAVKLDFGSLFGGQPAYLPSSYAAGIGFLVLVITLITKPQGLFGGGARDA